MGLHLELFKRESTSHVVGIIMSDLQVKDAKVDTGKVICPRAEEELKTRQTPSFTLSTTGHHHPKAGCPRHLKLWSLTETISIHNSSSLYGIHTTFCFFPQTPVFVQNTLNVKMHILFENHWESLARDFVKQLLIESRKVNMQIKLDHLCL